MKKILAVILVTNVVALCMSASIIDFMSGSAEGSRQNDAGSKNCICKELSCMCCLDLNISFIDLGGPGCVRLNYLSPEEGIAINVSYGESLLHNEVVRGPDPPPSCLNIFAKLAQMCARFKNLLPTDDGMKGCVSLEPMLLGEPQLDLPIGCFRMSPRGMEVIQSPNEVINELAPTETDKVDGNSTADEEGPDSLDGYTAADILAVVNESAEQGIALISNWFGIAPNATDEATPAEPNNAPPAQQFQQQQQHQQQQQQQQQQYHQQQLQQQQQHQQPQYPTERPHYGPQSQSHIVFGAKKA